MLGVGRRAGDFHAMLTHHPPRRPNRFTPDAIQRDSGDSATLRYELGPPPR